MGCRDGFANTGTIVKVAFFIVFISMFCNWLAFTTNSWYRAEISTTVGTIYSYIGLWRSCSGSGCAQTDGTIDTEYGVVQAFGIVGFMSQNVGFLLIVMFMFKHKCQGNNEIRLASAILLMISAVGWLIAVAIFGAEYKDGSEYLHYSYALAVCACGLGLIGGILMLVGGRGHGHGSVGSK
ncbi:hypothetical protein BsWGS_05696 [Bradybaena similaris]